MEKEFPWLNPCFWCGQKIEASQNWVWSASQRFHIGQPDGEGDCYMEWRKHCRKIKEEEQQQQ